MQDISKRKFGLEFEISGAHSMGYYARRLEPVLKRVSPVQFVATEEYAHSDGRSWHFKRDGSCGWELATPALDWTAWPAVAEALHTLREAGAEVTENCGLHVHHECRDFSARDARRLLLVWLMFEDVLVGAVHPSRRSNEYCRLVTDCVGSLDAFMWQLRFRRNFERISRDTYGHYSAINMERWWNLGLVEFRLHHATLDPDEVRRWTLLTQQLVEVAKRRYKWDTMLLNNLHKPVPQKLSLLRKCLRKVSDRPEVQELVTEVRRMVEVHHPHLLA